VPTSVPMSEKPTILETLLATADEVIQKAMPAPSLCYGTDSTKAYSC